MLARTEQAAIRGALQTYQVYLDARPELEFDNHTLTHDNAIVYGIKGGKIVIPG